VVLRPEASHRVLLGGPLAVIGKEVPLANWLALQHGHVAFGSVHYGEMLPILDREACTYALAARMHGALSGHEVLSYWCVFGSRQRCMLGPIFLSMSVHGAHVHGCTRQPSASGRLVLWRAWGCVLKGVLARKLASPSHRLWH
jgi:hypothetical protein